MRVYAFDHAVDGAHYRGLMAKIDGPLLKGRIEINGLADAVEPDQWLFDRVIFARSGDPALVQKVVRKIRKSGFCITGMPPPESTYFVFDIEMDGGTIRLYSIYDSTDYVRSQLRRLQLSKHGERFESVSERALGEVTIRSQRDADVLGIESYTKLVVNGMATVVVKESDNIELFEKSAMRRINKEMKDYGVTVTGFSIKKIVRTDTGEDITDQMRHRQQRFANVFLSHTHADKDFARKLRNDLMARGVKKVWFDEAEIKIGDSLIDKIQNGLTETRYFAVILSPRSLESSWVRKELEFALYREITSEEISIIPLVYENCQIPPFLEGKLYGDFRTPENYQAALEQLLDRLALPTWSKPG